MLIVDNMTLMEMFDEVVSVFIFSPHFFQRYRDRFMNGNNDLKGIELITHSSLPYTHSVYD